MGREKNGNMQFLGFEAELWNNTPQEELVAIKAREYSDAWTDWFATRFVVLYHRYIGKHIFRVRTAPGTPYFSLMYAQASDESELVDNVVYTERGNNRWMAALTASLSSAFPVALIVILNQCQDLNVRLAVLAIVTILFSIVLAVLSPNKKLEVFAASAAYVQEAMSLALWLIPISFAAVNVVFIAK